MIFLTNSITNAAETYYHNYISSFSFLLYLLPLSVITNTFLSSFFTITASPSQCKFHFLKHYLTYHNNYFNFGYNFILHFYNSHLIYSHYYILYLCVIIVFISTIHILHTIAIISIRL